MFTTRAKLPPPLFAMFKNYIYYRHKVIIALISEQNAKMTQATFFGESGTLHKVEGNVIIRSLEHKLEKYLV